MKKKETTQDVAYSEGNNVIIIDPRSEYAGQAGSVNRIGYAGDNIVYYHVLFPHHITPITFTQYQAEKISTEDSKGKKP